MGMKKRLLWLLLAGAAVLVYVGLQTGVIYGSVMGAAVAAGGAPWDAFAPGPAGDEAWAWYRDNLDGVLMCYTALCGLVFWGWWRVYACWWYLCTGSSTKSPTSCSMERFACIWLCGCFTPVFSGAISLRWVL